MIVRDRFGHQHRLSDYIGPCIPNGPISHKHAVGVSVRKELQCRDSGFVQSFRKAYSPNLRMDAGPLPGERTFGHSSAARGDGAAGLWSLQGSRSPAFCLLSIVIFSWVRRPRRPRSAIPDTTQGCRREDKILETQEKVIGRPYPAARPTGEVQGSEGVAAIVFDCSEQCGS